MKKVVIGFLLSLLFVFSLGGFCFAEELPPMQEETVESSEVMAESSADPETVVEDGWVEIDNELYYYQDGQPLKGLYVFTDDSGEEYLFYFDENTGAMCVGMYSFETDDGIQTYYFDENEGYAIKNQEKKIDGRWYYFGEDCSMATGLTVHDGKTYYYAEDGYMLYNWQTIDGKTYYFDSKIGVMAVASEKKIDGYWYYFDENGQYVTGEYVHNNATYLYDANGHMYYGWSSDGKSYYDSKVGKQAIGCEKKIDGYWYYFDENGQYVTGESIHNNATYLYDAKGHMYYGWSSDGKSYYDSKVGKKAISCEKKIGGYWYYFNEQGQYVTGFAAHNGSTYYYDGKGHMQYGFVVIDSKKYYFTPKTGKMAVGEKKIDGYWYYFDENGVMQIGWVVQKDRPDKKYYYGSDGHMKYGCQTIDGIRYFLDKATGVLQYSFAKKDGYWLCYDADGEQIRDIRNIIGNQSSYVIKVNKVYNTVTIYSNAFDGTYNLPVVAFICSTGPATPVGTFYTPNRWRWLRMEGIDDAMYSWGQWVTQIRGDYLFHSVGYDAANDNNTLNVGAYNKLGTTCSHGCIRLKAGDAKWIYDNCALSTKVVIYNDSALNGPLGRPSAYKLPSWHTWDPTDPNMYYKCQQNGCH